jgi:hypothetical protein
MNAQVVVQMLNKDVELKSSWSLCKKFRRLLSMIWDVHICHRETNLYADAFVHVGYEMSSNVNFYESYPTQKLVNL